MAGKKKIDPVSEAALEAVSMERLQMEAAKQEQADKEHRMAQCHQAIGRIQAAKMFAKFGNISELLWVKEVKESKIYKDLPGVGTWEKLCNSVGYSSNSVDDKLKNLEALGVEFSEIISDLRVSAKDIKRLRQLTHEGALQIEDGILVIGDEEIPLDADHREDLQAAMERLLDAKDQVIREKEATVRTKDRLIETKEKLIHTQEKELARFEGEAAKKGLQPGEDAFLRRMENLRIGFDGYMLKVDPERTTELRADDVNPPTPRMVAAYLTTLDYMRKQLLVAYDTAQDIFGSAAMTPEEAWTQPEE
jgi:hypothetical protein